MNAKVDGNRIYKPVAPKKGVKLKSHKYKLSLKIKKLNLILNMKALQNDDYIKCTLTKIEYAKTLFMYDIQMGQEVFIPKDLS